MNQSEKIYKWDCRELAETIELRLESFLNVFFAMGPDNKLSSADICNVFESLVQTTKTDLKKIREALV